MRPARHVLHLIIYGGLDIFCIDFMALGTVADSKHVSARSPYTSRSRSD
ncbi:MAG: hypothetical protein FWF60_06345 [Oscillospiraceae bacterium]|nr:hypothetical protein [Oscillospiraceae bacterium]